MKLNGRLKAIAEQISQCGILADIGTDHAFIPIYAVENGICSRAVAADLREGPLKIAHANISRHGLEMLIETRLGSGLEPIMPYECDTIVIAGMGGSLIRDILSSSLKKAQAANEILLQPNNAADSLRKWLYETGFDITAEILTQDRGKLYCIIKARWSGVSSVCDDFSYYIGTKIFEGNERYINSYLLKKLNELEIIIDGRSRSDPAKMRIYADESNMDTAACIRVRDRLLKYLEQEGVIPE